MGPHPRFRLFGSLTFFILTFATPVLASACALPRQQAPGQARESIIPVDSNWPGTRPYQIAISEDGQYVVYQANTGEGWKMFLHRLGEPEAMEIPGLGETPYFAHITPKNEWLLFGKKAWMWKAPLRGGDLTKLVGANPWIVPDSDTTFIALFSNTLRRYKADGSSEYEQVAGLETATGATNYHRPALLTDGKGALVSVGYGTGADNREIGVVSFATGELTTISERAINPRYSESGHILYTQGNTLEAIPFDLETLQPAGDPAVVVEGVHVLSNLASQFDISRTGVLVYVPGPYQASESMPKTLVWVDRYGHESPMSTRERNFGVVRISPNRRYVAAEAGTSLYVFDRLPGTWTRLASGGGTNGAPVWAHDSGSLFYSKAGALGRQPVGEDGVWGEWEELMPAEARFWGASLSEDGSRILGTAIVDASEQWQMASAATAGAETPEPMRAGDGVTRRYPVLSPDGAWMAFVEKVDGLDRIYVQAYPEGGEAVFVSEGAVGEAAEPVWGRDATELFFRDASNLVSVHLETAPALRFRGATRLFPTKGYARYLNTFATVYDYDVATDRFLMVKWARPLLPGTDIHVVENAFELLNRLAPGGSRW